MSGIRYQYTPEDKTFAESTNEVLTIARQDDWYVIADKQDSLVKDLNRQLKLDGQEYIATSDTERRKVVLEFVKGDEGAAAKLHDHYNQTLQSFALKIIEAGAADKIRSDINVQPVRRDQNMTHQAKAHGDEIIIKTDYFGLIYREFINYNLDIEAQIPGRIEFIFIWNPDKGFRLQNLGYSNMVLRDLSLVHRDSLLGKQEVWQRVVSAYTEEITAGLDAYQKKFGINAPGCKALTHIYSKLVKEIKKNTIDIFDNEIAGRLLKFFNMGLERLLQQSLKEDKENELLYAELASDLVYFCPAAKFFCEAMLHPAKQYKIASDKLLETLRNLPKDDFRKSAGLSLLVKVEQMKTKHPQDLALLTQVLWQTNRMIMDPRKNKDAYQHLCHDINKQAQWGKVIASAMAYVIFATVFALCCASTFGAALILPLVAMGLGSLIPATAISAIASLASFGFFAKSFDKNSNYKALAQEVATVSSTPKPNPV